MKIPDLVFLGSPGSGKGTQAKIICKKFNLLYFGMGQELRKIEQIKSELGQKVKRVIDSGRFVPSEMTDHILQKFVESHLKSKILIDGFPRYMAQSNFFDHLMKGLGREFFVVFIDLSEKEARARISTRGEGRADDLEEVENERFKFYREHTLQVIEKYRKEGCLIEIDGRKGILEVTKEIENKLA